MPDTPEYPAAHGLLDGKIVVVTAAAGTGIGFATAKRCQEEGATVVVSDHHERRLGEAADQLGELSAGWKKPLAVVCDVTQEDQVQRLVDTTVAEHGRIDVMVNNAGLGGTVELLDMTDQQWTSVLDVTLNGTFRCTRAALRHMVERGGGGAIVNNASVVGWRGAGRPGALRRGEGGRDGAHALRGDGGRARTACGSTRCRRAWRCTRSSPRSPTTTSSPS